MRLTSRVERVARSLAYLAAQIELDRAYARANNGAPRPRRGRSTKPEKPRVTRIRIVDVDPPKDWLSESEQDESAMSEREQRGSESKERQQQERKESGAQPDEPTGPRG